MSSDYTSASSVVQGWVADLPNNVYHVKRLGVISNGALKIFNRSPSHYRYWIDAPDAPPTPAMAFGSLFHTVTLEPAKFAAEYRVMPIFGDGNMRLKRNQEERDSWLMANVGATFVEQEDVDRARRMADSVRGHKVARWLVEHSFHEMSGYWIDPETGLQCKLRADCWQASSRIIGDLKSTEDASRDSFSRTIHNFSYHWQASLYRAGGRELSASDVNFLWVAVEKEPPYAVAVYELDRAGAELADEKVRATMQRFKTAIETDVWPAFGASIEPIALPPWSR